MKPRVFLTVLLGLGLVGCATRASKQVEPPQPVYLSREPDFEKTRSFQKLVKLLPEDTGYEKARIEYLWERLGASPFVFIRNNKAYSNRRAVMHLKWKYLRYRREASTAEDFVNRIASGSRKSGHPYLLRVNGAETVPFRIVLHNELKLLEGALRAYREKQAEEEPVVEEGLGQVDAGTLELMERKAVKKDNPAVENTIKHMSPPAAA